MLELPDGFADLFARRSFAHVATVTPDGGPHVTPVWVDADDDRVLVNSARGRRKVENVERDPRVAVSVLDPDNPYRHLTLRGEVSEVSEDGAVEHVDRLAGEYLGVDEYPHHGDESGSRVVLEIRPETVDTMSQYPPSLGALLRSNVKRLLH